jgi:glucose/arabinose dehydrogenase
VARGLEVPWSLALAPDGRLFVTERPGRLRVVREGRLEPTPVATLPVAHVGEGGLMGLALDPGFTANGRIYLCYTFSAGGALRNRVVRLVLRGDSAGDEESLLGDLPGASIHDGCRLGFGPDGRLYVTTGDAAVPELAQRLDSLAGKILRLNADGSVPADNPFRGSPVYSFGHRNPQGLDWDTDGNLYAAEHGPAARDEVNHIQAGRNYGWPVVRGRAGDLRFVDPLAESGTDTWAPSGLAVRGGELFVAGLRSRRLLRFAIDPGPSLRPAEPLLVGRFGRLRAVIRGPDGTLYVGTSNRDGRGTVAPDGDRILRVTP